MEFCSKFFLFLFLIFLNFPLPYETKAESSPADAIEVPEDIPYPCDLEPNGPAIKGCIMLLDWYREAAELVDANRTHPTPLPPTAALSIRNIRYSPSLAYEIYTCKNNICLCDHFAGDMDWAKKECTLLDGQILQKAVRKEIRMLTEEERKKLFSAFHQLKNGENSTEYSRFVKDHQLNSDFAHGGPAFLPWHREYLKRFEIALRYIDPTIAIPYWDSTLDQRLSNPFYSILWSEEFLGTPSEDGQKIVDGPFSNWTTIEFGLKCDGSALKFCCLMDYDQSTVSYKSTFYDVWKIMAKNEPLVRGLGNSPVWLLDDQMILDFEDKGLEGFLGFSLSKIHELCDVMHNFETLENRHSGVHGFVGGKMGSTLTSANDPVFWMHHAFIDWIWEDWRQRHQSPEQREKDYPEEYVEKCTGKVNQWHHLNSEMSPFKNDCSDRHYQCELWSIPMDGTDECAQNPLWMAENCRKSCKLCEQSREQKCKEMMPPED